MDTMFADDWFLVEVKQSEKVGRPEIDKFEVGMEREGADGRQRGFFVAFSYTSDAERECAAFHKRTGRLIKLLTVQEILDEDHVQESKPWISASSFNPSTVESSISGTMMS